MATDKGKKVRKYATADGEIVDEGDERARFLVAGINDDIDQELVDRIKANSEALTASQDHADESAKAQSKPDDKAVHKADNK